jgi:hypothetical protein
MGGEPRSMRLALGQTWVEQVGAGKSRQEDTPRYSVRVHGCSPLHFGLALR